MDKFFTRIRSKKRRVAGKLFVFEGPDGVGKTTVADAVRRSLGKAGIRSIVLSFPGREPGTLGELVYRLYHDPKSFGVSGISTAAEQLLFTAAHVDVIENRIIPTLDRGVHVLLDRFWWSTWVYSGVQKLDAQVLNALLEIELNVWGEIEPEAIFLLRRQIPRTKRSLALRQKYQLLFRAEFQDSRAFNIDNNGTINSSVKQVISRMGLSAQIQYISGPAIPSKVFPHSHAPSFPKIRRRASFPAKPLFRKSLST